MNRIFRTNSTNPEGHANWLAGILRAEGHGASVFGGFVDDTGEDRFNVLVEDRQVTIDYGPMNPDGMDAHRELAFLTGRDLTAYLEQ